MRPPKEPYYRHCLHATAFACFMPIRLFDWLRVSRFGRFLVKKGLVHDRSVSDVDVESEFAADSDLRREARVKAKMDDVNLAWTMTMSFYVFGSGCVYTSNTGEQRVLCRDAMACLAAFEPQSLLQLQRVVLQNPGKANAIGKAITRVQAFCFCSQCIARLSGNLAVSSLELNTFAHCISTLLIYIFWWDKPYDVETLTFVESKALDLYFLLELNFLNSRMARLWIYLPSGSGRTHRASDTYSISDAQGNRLIRGEPLIHDFRKGEDGLQASKESRTRIPNTGLHVSFQWSTSVVDPIYFSSRPYVEDYWNSFWSAWVELDRPLPPEPIAHTEQWLYRRTSGSPNLDTEFLEQIEYMELSPMMCAIMTLTFLVYGGLHLLAWQYNFNSTLEQYLWRISAATTASTGLVLLVLYLAGIPLEKSMARMVATNRPPRKFIFKERWISHSLRRFSYLLAFLIVASRGFLVIESFIALPNSPRSTYTIPSWTAYIPHI